MRGQSSSRYGRVAFAISIAILLVEVAFADSQHYSFLRLSIIPHIHIPPLVRFTGTLHPSEEPEDNGLHTLWISVGDKEWQFRLTNVEVLTGTNYGWMILSDIFPPHLRLSAPKDLLVRLSRPEIAGKPLTIEGRWYRANRVLLVTAFAEASDNAQ